MKLKIAVIIILVLVVGFTGWRIWKATRNDSSNTTSQEEVKKLPSINGELVDEDKATRRPIAVVIENHSDSRPQSGLNEADIVYETLAEGGITRFLAIFQTKDPKEAGPVRSARPYFNFLSNMWGASYVHAGGSKQALSELASRVHKNLFDVNEFSYGDYFYRDTERYAPHNLYTDIKDDQRKLLQKKDENLWQSRIIFQTQTTAPEQIIPEITKVTLPFSTDSYEATYTYDQQSNSYKRFIKSIATIDKNGSVQVSPKNVLIMLTDISTNPNDDLGTQNIKLTGNGPCFLFNNGKFKRCNWEYLENRHVYTDAEGLPLVLEAGQTWIEVFPRNRQNDIKWQ
ncbi:DUF3048 domain-containing protein [bacterium]|nr:MAG: DUF3048 domain-containing protein [bacterium]